MKIDEVIAEKKGDSLEDVPSGPSFTLGLVLPKLID